MKLIDLLEQFTNEYNLTWNYKQEELKIESPTLQYTTFEYLVDEDAECKSSITFYTFDNDKGRFIIRKEYVGDSDDDVLVWFETNKYAYDAFLNLHNLLLKTNYNEYSLDSYETLLNQFLKIKSK